MLEAGDSSFQSSILEHLNTVASSVGLTQEFTDRISEVVSEGSIYLEHSKCLKIHDSTYSWQQYYPVLSFLMMGNLHSDYERIAGLLGFPACSNTQWSRIVKRLEVFVSDLAERSCSQVRNKAKMTRNYLLLSMCFI